MVGAPLLAGMAALRTGAGLVTIATQSSVTDKLERRIKEIMTLALPDGSEAAADRIRRFIRDRKVSTVVLGPGLAVSAESRALIARLLKDISLPMVVDGGALGALDGRLHLLDEAVSGALILTPHTGEFQRLTGRELPLERPALKSLATGFAKAHRLILVLKGRPTYVAQYDGSVYENPTGNPGLATAGTGDVLSGVIAGMIAQGIGPAEAAEAGVYMHGLAGDIAAEAKTQPGMVASDVIEALPAALRHAGNDAKDAI